MNAYQIQQLESGGENRLILNFKLIVLGCKKDKREGRKKSHVRLEMKVGECKWFRLPLKLCKNLSGEGNVWNPFLHEIRLNNFEKKKKNCFNLSVWLTTF